MNNITKLGYFTLGAASSMGAIGAVFYFTKNQQDKKTSELMLKYYPEQTTAHLTHKEKAIKEYLKAKTDWEFTKKQVEKGDLRAIPYEPYFYNVFVRQRDALQKIINEENER